MKKLALFFLFVIIIVAGISYMYLNYKANYNQAQKQNKQYESYLEQEVYGFDLTTVINKAVDNNKNNNIEKDKQGYYINNDNNSIQIDINILDNEKTYKMETLYSGGMDQFVRFYGDIKFKCIKLEYHKKTNKVKYMLFEQITE